MDIKVERIAEGPSEHSVPASRPSTATTSARQVLPAKVMLNKPNKPVPGTKDQYIWSKLGVTCHMEPALIYWLIAAMLIIMGYDLAAFIPIILCVGDGLQHEQWLIGTISPFIKVVITRDFWVLAISTLLILLGNCASGLWLLFFGTLSPEPHLDQYWVTAELRSKTGGLHGRVFVAAAAVMLLVQEWTWAAGLLVAYGVLTLPLPPGWNLGLTAQPPVGKWSKYKILL